MCKKKVFPLIIIFLFLYIFNYLTPMGFGDDYLYSFIWQGNPEFVPLTNDATRISSWQDLFTSQWSHYFTWSGRTVNHTIAQFFLWMGKDVFNFFNAFIGTLLVVEIYWCIHKGQFTFEFNLRELWGICFVLWAFTPGFVSVFLWLDGACNYLWTSVLLLGFMLPYIRKYYFFSGMSGKGCLFGSAMFLYGVLTGWTNENSICLIIFVLLLFLYKSRDFIGTECWMYSGLAGLIIGYMLLMFSPGNLVRLQSVHGLNGISLTVISHGFYNYLNNLLKVIIFQFFMWYLCLRALLTLKQLRGEIQDILKKDILMAKVLCFITCGMSAVMLFSPEFPLRSGFPGTIQLIIATGILFRVQKDCEMHFFTQTAKKLMTYASVLFFTITVSVSIYNLYNLHVQTEALLTYISQNHKNLRNTTLTVKPFRKTGRLGNFLSGFHIIENDLSEDENSWINVAFARYYGIKSVRVLKEGTDCE